MSNPTDGHYGRRDLTRTILDALTDAGLDPGALDHTALSGVDEFHLGGVAATTALAADLDLSAGSHVLDVGCGIGGAARTLATQLGCTVLGVDLTDAFVTTARDLSALVGLDHVTSFEHADALDVPVEDGAVDAAVVIHVGMNIADKSALAAELARTVRRSGTVAIYDIMRVGDGDVIFPVPWAADTSMSFLATPDDYLDALRSAGLEPGDPTDRRELVVAALQAAASNPPAVNLAHLMGDGWPTMFGNLRAALGAGVIAPIQIIARRP